MRCSRLVHNSSSYFYTHSPAASVIHSNSHVHAHHLGKVLVVDLVPLVSVMFISAHKSVADF